MERFYLPYLRVKSDDGTNKRSVVVGVPLKTTLSITKSASEMREYLSIFEKEHYIVSCCSYVTCSYDFWYRNKDYFVRLSTMSAEGRQLLESHWRKMLRLTVLYCWWTSPEDQLKAYYHAHVLRKEIQSVQDLSFDIQKQLSIKSMNGWPRHKVTCRCNRNIWSFSFQTAIRRMGLQWSVFRRKEPTF